MKRFLGILCIITAFFMFSSASSVSWEGRAVLGNSSQFPGPGKYAKSRIFSTGEMVEVYNPANETKTTVVITGTSDVSGVLIMLSPEAAADLSITAGYDAIVRINKKMLYAEPSILSPGVQPAGNTAADPDTDPKVAIENTAPGNFRKARSEAVPPISLSEKNTAEESILSVAVKNAEEPAELVASPAIPENMDTRTHVPPAPQPEEYPYPLFIAEAEPESAVILPSPEPKAAAVIPEKPATESSVDIVSSDAAAIPAEPSADVVSTAGDTDAEALPVEAAVAEEIPEQSETVQAEKEPPVSLQIADVPSADKEAEPEDTIVSDMQKDSFARSPVQDEPEIISLLPDPSLSEPSVEVKTDIPMPVQPAETAAIASSTELSSPQETAAVSVFGDEGEYMLLPAGMLPPETIITKEISVKQAEPVPATVVAALPADLLKFCITDFEKGLYYIQLASMKDIQNITSVAAVYSSKYPFGIKEEKSGSGYRVYIGPLTKNEYGAVLERVKKFGFPDAFVKKTN